MTKERLPKSSHPRDILWSGGSLSFPYPLALLIGVGMIWYLVKYLAHHVLPGANPNSPIGWWGWWDQGCYWRSAQELSHFTISRDHYWYPLGYPLLGATFFRLMPSHAFAIPDLLCFAGILMLFYRICREFVSPWESFALGMIALVFPRKILVTSLVVPWSTIPSHLMIYAIIVLLACGQARPVKFFVAALFFALIPWFRAVDLFYLIPVFVVPLWEDLRQGKTRDGLVKLATLAGLFGISIGIIVAINFHVFGQATTPYIKMSTVQLGGSLHGILRKAYSMFVSASPMWNVSERMLIERFPYLLFVLPGIVYLYRVYSPKHLGWIAAIAGCVVLYLSFNGMEPTNLFKYQTVHCWAWWIPLTALLAYLGLVKAWKVLTVPGVLLLTVPCLLFVGGIQLKQKPVVEDPPAAPAEAISAAAASEQKVRLVLNGHRALPVSKLVIPEFHLGPNDYNRMVVTLNGRVTKAFHEYNFDVTDEGTAIVFRQDVPRGESIAVEFDRVEGQDAKQLFHLEAYCLEFGFGGGGFWRRGVQWFNDLSLPERFL